MGTNPEYLSKLMKTTKAVMIAGDRVKEQYGELDKYMWVARVVQELSYQLLYPDEEAYGRFGIDNEDIINAQAYAVLEYLED